MENGEGPPESFPLHGFVPKYLRARSFSRFRLDRGLCWQSCGRGIAFDVVGIPRYVALETVFDVRGRGETMVFARINDKLGGAAESLQGLVELLGVDDGNVPIYFASHDQSWRGDAGNLVERREFFIQRAIFPREA